MSAHTFELTADIDSNIEIDYYCFSSWLVLHIVSTWEILVMNGAYDEG